MKQLALMFLCIGSLVGISFAFIQQEKEPAKSSSAQGEVSASTAEDFHCGSPARRKSDGKDAPVGEHRSTFCGPAVQPTYPPEARHQHVEGPVHIKAVIGVDGRIKSLELIDGHPLLAPAALDAVKRCTFKPFLSKGKPIEIETVITVNFKLITN